MENASPSRDRRRPTTEANRKVEPVPVLFGEGASPRRGRSHDRWLRTNDPTQVLIEGAPMAMTKREQLLRIKDEYRATHGNQPASAREMADWAVAQGHYELPVYATARKCAEELADVMRLEYMTVEGGRRVRTM